MVKGMEHNSITNSKRQHKGIHSVKNKMQTNLTSKNWDENS